MKCASCKDRVAVALSTSPRPTGTRVRRGPLSMLAASTPSKASPSRWRSRSPSREIRVNGVAPGPTDTGMLTRFTGTPENKAALKRTVPMDRLGLSEELANAIVFIASDEASFITGHVLNVDGGKSH